MDVVEALFYLCIIYIVYKAIQYLMSLPSIPDLESRYIFVTGCDTGFGNAVAKKFDSMGCHVIAGCLTESGEIELRKSCSDKLHTVSIDVTQHDNVLQAFEKVKSILPQEKGEAYFYIYVVICFRSFIKFYIISCFRTV